MRKIEILGLPPKLPKSSLKIFAVSRVGRTKPPVKFLRSFQQWYQQYDDCEGLIPVVYSGSLLFIDYVTYETKFLKKNSYLNQTRTKTLNVSYCGSKIEETLPAIRKKEEYIYNMYELHGGKITHIFIAKREFLSDMNEFVMMTAKIIFIPGATQSFAVT